MGRSLSGCCVAFVKICPVVFGVCLEVCRSISTLLCYGSGISAFVLLCLSVSSPVLLLLYLIMLAASVCVLHPLQVTSRELTKYRSHLSASMLPWLSKGVSVGLYSVALIQCCLVLPPFWQSLMLLLSICVAIAARPAAAAMLRTLSRLNA